MTHISEIRAALAAATPGPWHSKGWLATREETDEADRTGVEDLITDANGKRVVGASWYDGEHIACTEPDASLIASSPTWLAELCDRVERAETHVASAEAHIDFVTDERERFAAQREEWRAMSIAHEARAESAEAKLAEVERERDGLHGMYLASLTRAEQAEAARDAAIAERDARAEDAKLGAAVSAVLDMFMWDHSTVRAEVESDRLAETVEGCIFVAIERAIRPADFVPAHAKASGDEHV